MANFPSIVKLGANIGARIDGVRLGGDLDASTVAAINDALLTHKVIFFRDQDHLDDDGQLAFARRLGTPTTAHPTVTSRGERVLPIDSQLRQGQQLAHRRDVRRPDPEGLAAARGDAARLRRHDHVGVDRGRLRPAARRRCASSSRICGRCTPISTTTPELLRGKAESLTDAEREYREEFVSAYYETEHPVVRVHPETGERVLLLGHFIKQFVGLGSTESATLFQLLQNRVTKLENTIRWSWQPGDLAIWDNRATQHYAVADYDDQYRRLSRITLAGDVPVDVYGTPSRVIAGDASHYSEVVVPLAG